MFFGEEFKLNRKIENIQEKKTDELAHADVSVMNSKLIEMEDATITNLNFNKWSKFCFASNC